MPEVETELFGIKFPDYDLQYKIHIYNTLCLIKNNLNPTEAKAGCPRNGSYSPTNEFFTDYMHKERVIVASYELYS